MQRIALFLAVLALALPAVAHAQSEEDAVRAAVDGLFDAMRAGDSTAFRAALLPQARLVSAGQRDGQPALEVEETLDDFVTAVGTTHEDVWDERLSDVEVRIDGRLATVWAEYEFYLGDRFSHCGVDAFQLFKGADGWRIFQIADTRRREGCEGAPGGESQ